MFDCKYGKQLRIIGPLDILISKKNALHFGSNITIVTLPLANPVGITNKTIFHCINDGKIEICDNVRMTSVIMSSRSSIVIESNVMIGANVRLYDHDFHSTDFEIRNSSMDQRSVKTMPIRIGMGTFIGTGAVIL